MFKIVKGSTLAALREQAAQLPGLRQQLTVSQEQAAAARQYAETARTDADQARADAEQARTALKVLEDDRVIGLAALRDAVRDPGRAPSVRGLIAAQVLRDHLAAAKAWHADNDLEIDPGLRMLEILLADDDGTRAVSNQEPDVPDNTKAADHA